MTGTAPILTPRLRLRPLTLDDAPFIVTLVNDADWLRFIGDKDVHDLDGARRYLTQGPLAMYERAGLGLMAVQPREGGALLGVCGLIRRDTLPDVDLGYALLPAARGRGLAREAAAAMLAHGRDTLALARLVAIVSPDNRRSIGVLETLGLAFERRLRLPGGDDELCLYGIDFATGDGTPLAVPSS